MSSSVSNPQLVKLAVAFQSLGCLGLLVMLLTAGYSQQVRRSSTWTSFCVSWIISCISYLLLFLAGQQTRPEPTFPVCIAQAAMIYASLPLTACTTFTLTLQFWMRSLRPQGQSDEKKCPNRLRSCLILVFPYLLYTAVLVESLVIGLRRRSLVIRSQSMYCVVDDGFSGRIAAVFGVIATLGTLLLEVRIAVGFRRNMLALRSFGARENNLPFPNYSMIVRVVLFNVLCVLSIFGCVLVLANFDDALASLFTALLPVAAALIFGTQMDFIRAWMFWKSQPIPAHAEQTLRAQARKNWGDEVMVIGFTQGSPLVLDLRLEHSEQ